MDLMIKYLSVSQSSHHGRCAKSRVAGRGGLGMVARSGDVVDMATFQQRVRPRPRRLGTPRGEGVNLERIRY